MHITVDYTYPGQLTIREALQVYFDRYHFVDGGYNDRFFRIKLGSFFIPVPNIPARIRAVKIHDIHHILTGYNAFWKGEIEIAGWEIGSGCGSYWVAWVLNSGSFMIGLFLYPRALFRAFLSGRRVLSNLYKGYIYDDFLLDRTVFDLRRESGMDALRPVHWTDYLAFGGWALGIYSAILFVISILLTSCKAGLFTT